ncbi:hypothetical protein MP228_009049 [Amoeboaphelidium protococcarum]|nr:hypothetical protein MP228_009049 [Amoeboaphelidium protococcarum]
MSSTSQINSGDTAWVMVSTALVMLMIPGVGYFYSGLARHKNALSLLFLSVLSLAVISIQWFMWGFSIAFSPDGGPFIGNMKHAFLMGVFDSADTVYPSAPNIPLPVFMAFQGMFAAITPCLALGAAAERLRIFPTIFFLFIWSTLVYDIIAYWTWAPNGWLHKMGSLDFAGGTPVHIASGAAGLAMSLSLKQRHGFGGAEHFKPHNLSSVFLGTVFLYFGWFGFNGGSELAVNSRASLAFVNTNLAACSGGLTWVLLDYRHQQKFSAFAFCSGMVSGLVSVTPACGYIPVWSSLIFGICGASACNMFLTFKRSFHFDDALDVFGVHGVGGIVGNTLTAFFASKKIVALDGIESDGGWIDGNFVLMGYQIVGTLVGFFWSFCITYLICFIMNHLPYMKLRLSIDREIEETDKAELGEKAYDYIEMAVQGSQTDHENQVSAQIPYYEKERPLEIKMEKLKQKVAKDQEDNTSIHSRKRMSPQKASAPSGAMQSSSSSDKLTSDQDSMN